MSSLVVFLLLSQRSWQSLRWFVACTPLGLLLKSLDTVCALMILLLIGAGVEHR